jgi:DNA-binding NarL/FixJ family response regulator
MIGVIEQQRDISPSKALMPGTIIARNVEEIMIDKFIGIIEERSFIRECIRRSLQQAYSFRVLTYSNVEEFRRDDRNERPSLIMLSCSEVDRDGCATALDELFSIEPNIPVIVLGPRSQFLNVAIGHGAKGYIPVTMEFDVVVEAVRVVLAGGSYMPMECLPNPGPMEQTSKLSANLTARELSVVRAIQLGKSNKVIAYNLNMTESTVKVHVRHIMAKLKAKNRTEVAIISEKYIWNSPDDQFD